MIKKGQVSKDLERIKNSEASELGVTDFFNSRDKSMRGAKGLVDVAAKTLEEEGSVKEDLYKKSLEVNFLPDHVSPMFTGVFLTARRNKLTENGLYLPTAAYGKGSDTDMSVDFSDKQIVVAVGGLVTQLKKGQEVVLNMDNFKRRLESNMAQKVNKDFEYVLPIEYILGNEYLYVSERDIKYISNTNTNI